MTQPAVDRERLPYRMKDLCALTGLDRQTIHFYIQQGLVPEGHKTGRNMAYYGAEHLERIQLVRRLAHERFLPLKAIRALLRGEDQEFTKEQRALLLEVKALLGERLGAGDGPRATVAVTALCEQHDVARDEVETMAKLGLLSMVDRGGHAVVLEDDAWMVELWGRLRRVGFTRELGFVIEELSIFEEAVSKLFDTETSLITPRVAHLPAPRVAEMVAQALPIVNEFLARYHTTKARNFFSALG